MYIVIYARSKELTVLAVAMMCHRAIQLGGDRWHKRLCIPLDRGHNMSIYPMTEFAIQILEGFPNIIGFIRSIHMISNDKISKTPAKFDNVIEVVFRMNVHKG